MVVGVEVRCRGRMTTKRKDEIVEFRTRVFRCFRPVRWSDAVKLGCVSEEDGRRSMVELMEEVRRGDTTMSDMAELINQACVPPPLCAIASLIR